MLTSKAVWIASFQFLQKIYQKIYHLCMNDKRIILTFYHNQYYYMYQYKFNSACFLDWCLNWWRHIGPNIKPSCTLTEIKSIPLCYSKTIQSLIIFTDKLNFFFALHSDWLILCVPGRSPITGSTLWPNNLLFSSITAIRITAKVGNTTYKSMQT